MAAPLVTRRSLLKRHSTMAPTVTSPNSLRYASVRLKIALDMLMSPDAKLINKQNLATTAHYAIEVLEAAFEAHRRIAMLGHDHAGEVETLKEAEMDDTVREWLQSTFSRPPSRLAALLMAVRGGSQNDAPPASSGWKAVRIGMAVDLFRRNLYIMPIPSHLTEQLQNITSWDDFNVFELHRLSEGHALLYAGSEILNRLGCLKRFKIRRGIADKFFRRLEEGYSIHRNPFHNILHAADVTQATFHYIAISNLTSFLSDVETFSMIIAAAIHDFEHTGTTNSFHVNSASELANNYNDKAVLENFHVSTVFRAIASDHELDIFQHMTNQEYREMRSLVIDLVLGTDMQYHFQQMKVVKTLISLFNSDPGAAANVDKAKVLALLVHNCDVSHPARPWVRHRQWTQMVCEEFFAQGDLEVELDLPISPMCDRTTTSVATSQIGFIDFIVAPVFDLVVNMLEAVLQPMFQDLRKASGLANLQTVEEEKENVKPSDSLANGDKLLTEYQKELKASEAKTESQKVPLPLKWDLKNPRLFIKRFYLDNVNENKTKWKGYVEEEAKDPDVLKRTFHRDPVVELGWKWPPPPPVPGEFDEIVIATIEELSAYKEDDKNQSVSDCASTDSIVDEEEIREERAKAGIEDSDVQPTVIDD